LKDAVRITNHGDKRIRKRLGLSKQSVDKNATKAFECGITHAEATGQLNKYISKLFLLGGTKGNYADNIRIYNHYVYIFSGSTLITVMKLPKNLESIEDSIKQKKMIAEAETTKTGGITSIDN